MRDASTINPVVVTYLQQFDDVAGSVPVHRRRALRQEIADHLSELVPADVDEEEARLAILDFGTPEEIVAQESPVSGDSNARHGRAIALSLVAVVAIAAAVLLAPRLALPEEPAAPLPERAGASQPVVANPDGPPRVTEGAAFHEYASTIASMPPLPQGAAWPAGMIAGMDAGVTTDGSGVLEAGFGVNVANFTFVCAWEFEGLAAAADGDMVRLDAAHRVLSDWSTEDFWTRADSEGQWSQLVLDPIRDGSVDELRSDLPRVCLDAGIPVLYRDLIDQGL